MNQSSRLDDCRLGLIISIGLECDRAKTLVILIDKMIPEAHEIDPICAYFLRMCRQGLIEAEQEKAKRAERH
jgi:hypothetical protein